MKDYEETIAFLGQWGRFQQIIFFLLCVLIMSSRMITFSSVFLADIPNHHCMIPNVNLTQDWLNSTIPKEVVNGKEKLSSCSRYRLDVVRNLSAQGLIPGRDVNLTDLEQEDCVDGWSYSKDIYQSTIVSEFDLVCTELWKQPFTSTAFLSGLAIGSFFSGQIADRFGRKPVIFAGFAFRSLSLIAAIFSPSWTMFAVFFFIAGVGSYSTYMSTFVLGNEILTGKVRGLFASIGICVSFAVGYMLLPVFAYFLRDWKHLQCAISVPALMFLPFWWVIPESPRWLLSQGRVAEVEAVVRKAAKTNKVEAPLHIFEGYSVEQKKKQSKKHYNVLHLVKTGNIRTITLIVCLVWFTLRTGYYGLSLNTSQLHPDPYISCFMSAATEIPAQIFVWLALQYLHRRLILNFVLLLGAASLFFIQLVPESLTWLVVTLELLGKFTVTAGVSLVYVYAAEIYPTVLRNTAIGSCSTLSFAGSTAAPFLFKLQIYFQYLPNIILGTLTIGAAIAVLFLPETFKKPLPQTIEEMTTAERIKCPSNKNRRKEYSSPMMAAESQH